MPIPRGGRFVAAPMKYFLRFDGANGMHAGHLPGYAASHGCVRLPQSKAILFFNTVPVGATVHIFGKAPVRKPDAPRVERHKQPQQEEPPTVPQRRWFPFF
jgi:hypothetical protein